MRESHADGRDEMSVNDDVADDLDELKKLAALDPVDVDGLRWEQLDGAREVLERLNRIGRDVGRSPMSGSDALWQADKAQMTGDVSDPEDHVPTHIGPYEIKETIARGGMGVVFRARDVELNRVVALKMMVAGPFADEDERVRFRGEAEAAARLDHPGIVPVYDVGRFHGQPYFTMGFVPGHSLATRIADGPIDSREAAELARQISVAIQFAHDHGVIHRDLKPGNVLIDASGKTRVTDFGLARRVDSASDLTRTGQVIGTPSYMAPEQARGELENVGPASDVYSLGATLYALLTGRPPFQSSSTVETIRMVLERDPISPRQLNPSVPIDLAVICMKCLQKPSTDRYSSAGELAADLTRFLNHEPVQARMPPLAVRAIRWCRRSPFAAALIALLLVLAIGGPLVAIRQLKLHRDAELAREQGRQVLYVSDMNLAMRDWDEANIERCGELLKRHRPLAGQADVRGFEWYYLSRLWKQSADAPVLFNEPRLESMALSADERLLALGTYDGSVVLVDLENAAELGRWKAHPYRTHSLDFSADGKMLASASVDNEVGLWDVPNGNLIRKFPGARAVAFSPVDNTFAYRSSNVDFTILTDLDAKPITIDDAHDVAIGDLTFSPDGRSIASAGWDSRIRVWDSATGKLIQDVEGHGQPIWSIDWSPSGDHLVCGGTIGIVSTFDAKTGHMQQQWKSHQGTIVNDVHFSPDSLLVLSAGGDNTIDVRRVNSGHQIRTLRGHYAETVSVEFASDGDELLSASIDGRVKRWTLEGATGGDVLHHGGPVNSIDFSPDGTKIVSIGSEGVLRVWDVGTSQELITQAAHDQDSWTAKWLSYDGDDLLVTLGGDGHLIIWDYAAGSISKQRTLDCYEQSFATIPFAVEESSGLIAFPDSRFTVAVWDARSKRVIRRIECGTASGLTFISDRVIAIAESENLYTYDVKSGALLNQVHADSRSVRGLDVAPNGVHLASACYDRTIKIWNLEDLASSGPKSPSQILKGHGAPVSNLGYSPDGTMIASVGDELIVRLWDVNRGHQRAAFRGHTGEVNDAAFSPDGQIMATSSNDSTVRLWRAPRVAAGDLSGAAPSIGP